MSTVAFIGNGSLLVRCAAATQAADHSIPFIVSGNTEVRNWAARQDIPTYQELYDVPAAELQRLDFFFSIAYLEVIPARILEQIPGTVINFHDGPLPAYAGLHVTTWAILQGEQEHAICWHEVTEDIDAGGIVASATVPIDDDDTAFSLNLKCFDHGARVFSERLLPQIATARIAAVDQPAGPRTMYTRHQKPSHGGCISWADTAETIDRLVRALNFGQYPNPVASAKLRIGDSWYVVSDIEATDWQSDSEPGTVISIGDSVSIACGNGVVEIQELLSLAGESEPASTVLARHGVSVGDILHSPKPETMADIAAALTEASRAEYQLVSKYDAENLCSIEGVREPQLPADAEADTVITGAGTADRLAAACVAYLLLEQQSCSGCLLLDTGKTHEMFQALVPSISPAVLHCKPDSTLEDVSQHIEDVHAVAADVRVRRPEFRNLSPTVAVVYDREKMLAHWNPPLVFEIDLETGSVRLWCASGSLERKDRARLVHEAGMFIRAAIEAPERPLKEHSLLTADDRAIIENFNRTSRTVDYSRGIHELVASTAREVPDRVALQSRNRSLTYAEIAGASARVAGYLRRNGVERGALVGVCVERSPEMVLALLGVLHAGAAYVPLDPEYPHARLQQMVEDAEVQYILIDDTTRGLWSSMPEMRLLSVNDAAASEEPYSDTGLLEHAENALAYTIFTSGSTGRPKGVMISHRNVLNFFAGMDARLPRSHESAWLSVTSLSFDISVLELLWTLTRGVRVILFHHENGIVPEPGRHSNRPVSFSLSYFASETDSFDARAGYSLLYEGVAFADSHNFEAVWTPERHFHDFGGLFPNPSVTSAALAARTKNLFIRAGSVVAPLHHPVRIAEDWALVDQLSEGRAGVSFASGWQQNDFVLRPEAFEDRKEDMFRSLEQVRRLWRGEELTFSGVDGAEVPVRIRPLPQRLEIPVWITAAGNPETFRRAGEVGANVLTHLLGQRMPELKEKIAIYRAAWEEAGHEGQGHVTVMVHTFVGTRRDEVREKVYGPLTEYLRSAVGLIKQAPYAFPTFKKPTSEIAEKVEAGVRDFSEEEISQLTDFAFERYFESSGLFGTIDECVARAHELRAVGTDEIACLIDFGVDHEEVVRSLPLLDSVRQRVQDQVQGPGHSLTDVLRRESVSHFQCTPSFMEILTDAPDAVAALRSVDTIMLGGEALQPSLVEKIRPGLKADATLLNMYGPTETTIWSAVADVGQANWLPYLGTPIANTGIYIVDSLGRLVAPGKLGEIWITGEGLSAGYLGRPDLTADRFVSLRLPDGQTVRAYRTGDLARIHADGRFEFVGRNDSQVKVSGYRIELSEIEQVLSVCTGVDQAVVVVQQVQGIPALKAYFRATTASLSPASLRESALKRLPRYMVPASFEQLTRFPLTPNGKVDRVRLATTTGESPGAGTNYSPKSAGTVTEQVVSLWKSILSRNEISIHENLFDIGANSLMVVQAAVQLRDVLQRDVALVDIFRNPTIAGFVSSLDGGVVAEKSVKEASSRASKRRAFLGRRQARE